MILHGSFSVMSLEEVLQWCGLARKSGRLAVHHNGATTHLFFEDGTIRSCVTNDPPKLLGQFLVFLGTLDTEQLRAAMNEHRDSGTPLSEVIVNHGWADEVRLTAAVSAKAEETIFGLFDLDDATFTFEPGVAPAANNMKVELRAEDLLLRGVKRFDETARIRELFPQRSAIVRRTDSSSDDAAVLNQPINRRIFEVIDGRRSISDIILHVHGSEFLVTRALLELLREGLIETVAAPRRAVVDETAIGDEAPSAQHPESAAAAEADPLDPVRRAGLDPQGRPLLVTDREQLVSGPISAAEEFLVNLCDGSWEIEELVWVTPLAPAEVARAIVRLIERGTLEIRHASNLADASDEDPADAEEDSAVAEAG
jgi:hypothetical protein